MRRISKRRAGALLKRHFQDQVDGVARNVSAEPGGAPWHKKKRRGLNGPLLSAAALAICIVGGTTTFSLTAESNLRSIDFSDRSPEIRAGIEKILSATGDYFHEPHERGVNR